MESIQRKRGEGFSRGRIAIVALLTFVLVSWFTYLLMYGGPSYQVYAPRPPAEMGEPGGTLVPMDASSSNEGLLVAVMVVTVAVLVALLVGFAVVAVRGLRWTEDVALRMSRTQDRIILDSTERVLVDRKLETLDILKPIIDHVYHEPVSEHDISRDWRFVRTRIRAIVPAWGKETEDAFLELVNHTLRKDRVERDEIPSWETDVLDAFDRFTAILWRDLERANRRG